MKNGVWAILCLLTLPTVCHSQPSKPLLPDSILTPGVADPAMDKAALCSKKFTTRDERHVTAEEKKQVYAEYHTAPGRGRCIFKTQTTKSGTQTKEGCEVDHLISLEIGGSNDTKNLWPQPYTQHPGAHEKDTLENWLHKQVCSGAMSLADAQESIHTDWFAAYKKMLATKSGSKSKQTKGPS